MDRNQGNIQILRKKRRKHIFFVLIICAAAVLSGIGFRYRINGLHPTLLTGRLCFYEHGFVDRYYTGIVEYDTVDWYVKNGKTDSSFSGFVKAPEGWYRIKNGTVDTEYTGFVKDGIFYWYLTDGKVRFDTYGLYYGEVNREIGWWNVLHGQISFNDDVVKAEHDWWCVQDGKVRFSYDGFADNRNGKWYLKNGRVDFSGNGIVLSRDGTYFIEKGRVLGEIHSDSTRFIAHRGLSSKAPENTVRAFVEAGKAGFWGCETDVWETADHKFVLQHDENFERMCGTALEPGDLTSDEIKQFRILSGNQIENYQTDGSAVKVAFLDEFLKVCRRYDMVPVIEIKDCAVYGNEEDMDRLQQLFLTTKGIMGDREVIYISFDFASLKLMHEIRENEHASNITLQYLTKDVAHVPFQECRQMEIDIDVGYTGVAEHTIASVHDNGLEVNVWTVNKAEPVYELILEGVDYITTNNVFWLDI